MPIFKGLETASASEVDQALADAWASCSTSAEQNAGRSEGDRLVTKLRSTTTSSSTTLPPAFRRSVRMLGYDVSFRPATTPASTSVHGP